jgi:UDP-glucuronate decarboxylase
MNVADVHDPVNLGNPGEFTIKQLAEEVVRICGSKSGVEYLPLPEDDPKQRRPDISRAQKLLDWNPTIALNEGLLKTISYFKQRADSKQQTADSRQQAAGEA